MSEFEIRTNLRGFDLHFKTTYDLFSYRKIDDGTKLLIKAIEVGRGDTCLDLGCGYGPIGISLAKLNPSGEVYMVDRDVVAVKYAKENCELNQVKNCIVIASNGFEGVKDKNFAVVASNLPTHIAKESRLQWFKDAKEHLVKNGKLYVVTVNKVQPFVRRSFNEIFGNYKKVEMSNMHTVSLAVKSND